LEKKVTEPKAHSVRYHEAGHAVVARLLGIPVNEVTARPARGAKFRGLTVVTVDGIGPFAGLDLRREFTALMGAGITWPFAALAQAGRSYRLGCLLPATRDTPVNVAFSRKCDAEVLLKAKTSRSIIAHMGHTLI
jgi:hypothetical protein